MDPVGILTCQALAAEIRAIADDVGRSVVVRALPSSLDLYPSRLYRLIDVTLDRMTSEYRKVVLGYGHCCFLMEDLARRHHAVRVKGSNCYEILAGSDTMQQLDTMGKTYYLTPYLSRNFDRVLRAGFGGVGRMKHRLADVQQLAYLDTGMDETLVAKAREIAYLLSLPLTVRFVGLAHVKAELLDAINREIS